MSVRITEIGGHRFVAGLFWQTLSQKDRKKEAKALAEDLRFDYVVFRNSDMPQVGFAAAEDGAEEGLFSIAAMISKSLEMEGVTGNWMGAFLLPDGDYAYVAIRDNIFLSDGDMIGSEQEVRQIMSTTFSLGDWDHIFAPQDFDFRSSEEKDIEDLIPSKKGKIKVHKWWALQPTNKSGPSLNLGGKTAAVLFVIVIIGISAAGFKLYQNKQSQKLAAEQAKAIEVARLKMFGDQAAKQKELQNAAQNSKPWADMVLPTELAEMCLNLIDSKMTGAGGWKPKQIVCDSQNITATYERAGSTIGNLLSVLPGAQVDQSGDKATYIISLAKSEYRNADDLAKIQDGKLILMDKIQQIGAVGAVQDPPPPQPPLPGSEQANNPIPVPPWKKTNFTIDTKMSPDFAAAHISMPGLRVTKITMDGINDMPAWKLEGELYGN